MVTEKIVENNLKNSLKKERTLGLFSAFACVAGTGIGFGLSLPLLSFVMKELGFSSTLIGLNTTMPAIAAFLLAPMFVKFMEKYGIKLFIIFCVIGSIASLFSFYFIHSIFFWFVLRFIFGACLDGIFVASETWIAELSTDENRGKIMGLFSSFLSVGYFLGAGVLRLTGSKGILPFFVGMFFLALVILFLTIARKNIPNVKSEHQTPIMPIVVSTPIAMGAAIVYGYLETSAFNLLPIYGVNNNLTEERAVTLLIVVGFGQACLQYFIGALADKFGERVVLIICTLIGIMGAIGIKVFLETPYVLYFIMFFWGACINGFYTLALIFVGKKYNGSSLAAANSAVVAMFGLGSLIGPPIAGYAMSLSVTNGFSMAMLLPVLLYLVVLFRNPKKKNSLLG